MRRHENTPKSRLLETGRQGLILRILLEFDKHQEIGAGGERMFDEGFSNIRQRSWESKRVTQTLATETTKTMCCCGDCSCSPFIHLGPNCTNNLEVHKKTRTSRKFRICSKSNRNRVWEHSEEILNVKIVESASLSWTRSVLCHDQLIQWTKARVCVYSDSVLCLGKMSFHKEAITSWDG